MLSIIIATYNLVKNKRVDTFRQCIESIRSQHFKDLEIVIIDGASSDGSIELIHQTFDESKELLYRLHSEPDEGIYDAMNKGIHRSQGEYIYFLNSDDYLTSPKSLSEIMRLFADKPLDYAYAPILFTEANGSRRTIKPQFFRLLYKMPFSHQGVIIRKNVFREIGDFNTNLAIGADHALILKMITSGYSGNSTPEILATFRDGGASAITESEGYMEKARIFYEVYHPVAPNLSTEDFLSYINKREFPSPVSLHYLRDGLTFKIKIAAIYSLFYTLRHKVKNIFST